MSKTKARIHWYVLLAQVLILTALALRSSYQDATADETDPPSRVERRGDRRGPLSFQPAAESTLVSAVSNRSLRAGDRLWTDGGDPRPEPITKVGTGHLEAAPDFGFGNLDDRLVRMLLLRWTVTVRVKRPYGDEVLEVAKSNLEVSILQSGSYRVEASEDGPSTLVTVRAGESQASGGGDRYTVDPGQSTGPGTDHPETALTTLQISVKTDEEVRSRLAGFGTVGQPPVDFPALPRSDEVPQGTVQLSGTIDSAESMRASPAGASSAGRTDREIAPASTKVASRWPTASRTKSIAPASLESSMVPTSTRFTATRFPSAAR